MIPNLLARIAPGTAKTSGADLLSADATVGSGIRKVIVTVALSAAAILYLRVSSQNLEMNDGVALAAGRVYAFELQMSAADAFNFRISADATVRLFTVAEYV